MVNFIVGAIVGVFSTLFLVSVNKSNSEYEIYMEGYCDGIKSVGGNRCE